MAKENDQGTMEREQPEAQPDTAQEVQEAAGGHRLQLTIEPLDYNPALDPDMPEFDEKAFADALQHAFENANEVINSVMAKLTSSEKYQGMTDAEQINVSAKAMVALFYADTDSFRALAEALNIVEQIAAKDERYKTVKELLPYLITTLKEMSADPQYANISLYGLLQDGLDENGNPTDSPYKQAILKAGERKAYTGKLMEGITLPTEQDKTGPHVTAKPTDLLTYPLDKPNSVIWNLLATAETNGQMRFGIDVSRKGGRAAKKNDNGKEAIIFYGIDFDALEPGVKITKALNQYDKLCYIAAAALYNAGNPIITVAQIYRMMGYDGTPGDADREKINSSLTKMGAAHVYIDNKAEVEAQKASGYPPFCYDASLLPFERIRAVVNGQPVDAIHLFREPPLITFAKERKQITPLSRQLLANRNISKTEENLKLQDYLLERIGRMKGGGNVPKKILFATICDRCRITGKQVTRLPGKIEIFLKHFKKCEWIKGYKMEADSVTIQV